MSGSPSAVTAQAAVVRELGKPFRNRNEVFSGGYIWYPDKPTITWTDDQLGPAIFYHDRKLNEAFLSVST